jgi:serine/threonine protein kinase
MTIQTCPAKRWKEEQPLGAQGGGMNGGIFVVCDSTGNGHIEKRLHPRKIESGGTGREVIDLQQVGHYQYIPTMTDHYIDYRNRVASIYLERCTRYSLQRLIRRHIRKGYRMIVERYIW